MSAAQSQSQTALLPPPSYWSVKQAGRGRKLKSRRGARDGEEGRGGQENERESGGKSRKERGSEGEP